MAISPQQLTIYLYSAHRAVIFAIAQLSCYNKDWIGMLLGLLTFLIFFLSADWLPGVCRQRCLVSKVQQRQMPDIGMLFLNLRVRRSHLVSDSLNEVCVLQPMLYSHVGIWDITPWSQPTVTTFVEFAAFLFGFFVLLLSTTRRSFIAHSP